MTANDNKRARVLSNYYGIRYTEEVDEVGRGYCRRKSAFSVVEMEGGPSKPFSWELNPIGDLFVKNESPFLLF